MEGRSVVGEMVEGYTPRKMGRRDRGAGRGKARELRFVFRSDLAGDLA